MSTQLSTKIVQSKTKVLVLLAAVLIGTGLLTTLSQPASASHFSEGIWANAVNACAIDEVDVRQYAVGRNYLGLRDGVVGTVTARCNVENLPVESPSATLQLVYRDLDGPGTAYRVIAKLQRLSNDPGGVQTLATVDSNSINCPAFSPTFQSCFAGFSHDFDFDRNAYYVEVSVVRNDTAQFPVASIVRITREQIP